MDVLPPDALVCRWGGDEFVLLVSGQDQAGLEQALGHAQHSAPFRLPDLSAFSVGLAVWQADTPFERAFAVADEQLQQQKEVLDGGLVEDLDVRGFVEFSQRLEALSDPDDIVQHALDNLLNLLDFDHAVYFEWEGDDMYVSHLSVRPGIPVPTPPVNVRLPIAGLVAKVQRLQKTAWSTDYTTETETMPMMVSQGVRSALLTPVFSQGQVVASLVLRTVDRWQTITPHMRKVMELTALRLEHALELRRAVAEVRSTLESGLLTLGIVLEARDLETHGHTERAAAMAVQLGTVLGWQGADLDRMREGAYLHDLGKICISDTILQKPGQLTADEWNTMKTHVTLGWELASRIQGLSPPVLEVIRHHHERWDGTGYPDGLAGTEIPLAARIFAVCDVYDALISERPYKKAWTDEEAVMEIERESGRHFDPGVVHAFLSLKGRNVIDQREPNGTRPPVGVDALLEG
jgi:putative nucleotidyltransferase with HDIG domain